MPKISSNPKNICVSLMGPLGDVVNSSSVFRRLRECYPDATISILTVERGLEATYGIQEIDNRYTYEKLKGLKGLFHLFCCAKEIPKQDLYIVLDNSFRSALFSFFNGAKCRIGRKGQNRDFLFTHTIPLLKEEYDEQIPVYEHYYRCLKPLNIYNTNNKTSFYFSDEDEKKVNEIVQTHCKTDKPKVGLCLLAANYKKSIEMENSVEIISALLNKFPDYEYIVLGGADIKQRCDELCEKTGNKILNLAGKTSYRESACLIDKCEKIISVDTSPLHLAIARKTPVLAIFFTHIFKKWGPEDLDYNRLILNMENKNISVNEVLEKFEQINDKSFYLQK